MNCEVPFHLTDIAWYCGNANGTTHQIGTKTANAWGLFDMSGNIYEWAWDWYGTYPGTATDTTGASSGSSRAYRGGSLHGNAGNQRSANRYGEGPGGRNGSIGIRLARSLPKHCEPDACNGYGTCDPSDGACTCDNPNMTADCGACLPGFIGYPDCRDNPCDPNPCNGHGGCDTSDGSCACYPQYTGTACDECGPEFGLYPNCVDLTPGFAFIPQGTFTMGSPESEAGRDDDEVEHLVTLTIPFEIMKYEVTQGEFVALMGYNPSGFAACGSDCPVEQLSWHEALKHANFLSQQKGYAQCYDCSGTQPNFTCSLKAAYAKPQDCPGYRLPTEAEWEYAARAGSTSAYYDGMGGDDSHLNCEVPFHLTEIAWYCGNANSTTHQVGTKTANSWGLYDMSGNVYEWLWDWWGGYTGVVIDPSGPVMGSNRALRGNSMANFAKHLRSANRSGNVPEYRNGSLGFRLVRTLP